jgi:hypothetical protein
MINNTFYIVFRKSNHKDVVPNPNQDRYGWEFADNIERMDWKTAKADMEEYRKAMPQFHVCIRAISTDPSRGEDKLRPQEA